MARLRERTSRESHRRLDSNGSFGPQDGGISPRLSLQGSARALGIGAFGDGGVDGDAGAGGAAGAGGGGGLRASAGGGGGGGGGGQAVTGGGSERARREAHRHRADRALASTDPHARVFLPPDLARAMHSCCQIIDALNTHCVDQQLSRLLEHTILPTYVPERRCP
jgi:hypothetical protein